MRCPRWVPTVVARSVTGPPLCLSCGPLLPGVAAEGTVVERRRLGLRTGTVPPPACGHSGGRCVAPKQRPYAEGEGAEGARTLGTAVRWLKEVGEGASSAPQPMPSGEKGRAQRLSQHFPGSRALRPTPAHRLCFSPQLPSADGQGPETSPRHPGAPGGCSARGKLTRQRQRSE